MIFYVNGISHGVAATGIPSRVYAVVDLYGKVVQVSVSSPELPAVTPVPPSICGEVVTGIFYYVTFVLFYC